MNIVVKTMTREDIPRVKALINKNILHKSMLKVFEASDMASWNAAYDDDMFDDIVENTHAYLLIDQDTDTLLASGYINLCDDGHSSHIGMVFTDFEYRMLGLGRRIMEILEQDDFAKQSDRLVLGASMSAYRFYRKLGYACVDGTYQLKVEKDICCVQMEKFTKKPEAI